MWVAAFSVSQTKLPSYITPTHPAVAVLVGRFLQRLLQSAPRRSLTWPHVSALTLASIGLVILIVLPTAAHFYLPGDEVLGLLGVIPLAGGLMMYRQLQQQRVPAAVHWLAGTAVAFCIALFGLVAPQVSRHQQIQGLLELATQHGRPCCSRHTAARSQVGSFTPAGRSLCCPSRCPSGPLASCSRIPATGC